MRYRPHAGKRSLMIQVDQLSMAVFGHKNEGIDQIIIVDECFVAIRDHFHSISEASAIAACLIVERHVMTTKFHPQSDSCVREG